MVAGWLLPWLRGAAPSRYWNKVVAAATGISLAFAASGLAPAWFATAVIAICLGLLIESFGRDVLWLYSRHRAAVRLMRAPGHGLTATVLDAHPGGVADIGRAA